MFLEIFLFGCCLLILLSLHFGKHGKYKELSEKIGCYKHIPFFGVSYIAFDLKESLYKWSDIVKNVKLKSAFVYFGPNIPMFYTYNREYVQKFLLSPDCNGKGFVYSRFIKELGLGLVALRGQVWRKHRKLLNPLFSQRYLMNAFTVINKYSSSFVKELENVVGKGETDLGPMLMTNTIKTSVAFQIGLELKDDNEEHVCIIYHILNFMATLEERLTNLFLFYDPFFRWTKLYQSYNESKKFFVDFIKKIIKDKIDDKDFIFDLEHTDVGGFLQQTVDFYLRGDFSMNEAVSEILTTLMGSFDSSSNTLEVFILSLAMYPEYQEKLFEEVQRIFPDEEFDVKYEDLQHLVYMEQFLNETLRFFSIAPQLGRHAQKDIQISSDIVIPSGTEIVIDVFRMHRDKDSWGPNADKFNPNNFSPENLTTIPPYAFIPFSKGPRDCIGSRFAKIFIKSNLAKIVRNFRFETRTTIEDLHILFVVFSKLKTAPLVKVYKR